MWRLIAVSPKDTVSLRLVCSHWQHAPAGSKLCPLIWNCTRFAGHWPCVVWTSRHQCQGPWSSLRTIKAVTSVVYHMEMMVISSLSGIHIHIQITHTGVHYRMLSFRRREMDGSMEVAIKCISTVPVTVMDVKWTGISRTNNNEMVSAGDTEISLHIRAPWTLNLPSGPSNLTTFHFLCKSNPKTLKSDIFS